MSAWIMLAIAAGLVTLVVGAAVLVLAVWAVASDALWRWRIGK